MLRFVTALRPEAKPVIDRFQLKSVAGTLFPLYRSRLPEDVALVVSGIGKTAAAAATAYLHARTEEQKACVWVNLGLAGHRERPLGEACLAHTVCDDATGDLWYPPRLQAGRAAALKTVEAVETSYRGDWLYDMEASGFYRIALKLTTAELVQCFKVVSDNATHPPEALVSTKVEELIASSLPDLLPLLSGLQSMAAELRASQRSSARLPHTLARWRFTTSQRRRLDRLLKRWEVLHGETAIDGLAEKELGPRARGGDVLTFLERRLRERSLGHTG